MPAPTPLRDPDHPLHEMAVYQHPVHAGQVAAAAGPALVLLWREMKRAARERRGPGPRHARHDPDRRA